MQRVTKLREPLWFCRVGEYRNQEKDFRSGKGSGFAFPDAVLKSVMFHV